jgi:hypothetical protein
LCIECQRKKEKNEKTQKKINIGIIHYK